MNEQLTLFEPPQSLASGYSLFIAIFPDPRTAQHITDLGNTLRRKHGMHGRLRPITHLHVSLHSPNPFMDIGHVCEAVTTVTRPFEICFDRVMSFRGQLGNRAIVLAGDDHVNNEVKRFHTLLCCEFAKHAPTRPTPKLNPHVTLLYDRQELVSHPIEPVYWTVKEIVLVASEVGATKYHRLGCWPLSG